MINRLAKLSDKFLLAFVIASTSPLLASAEMPWEGPLSQIQASLEGPTAKALIILSIVGSGLTFAFGEAGGFFRKAAGIVFGASVAAGATSLAGALGVS